MKHFHVNASLPRCGSELLQCLLSQHPDVYGSAQSPLADFSTGAHNALHSPQALSHGVDRIRAAHTNFLKYGFKGFYSTISKKPIVVDKSRAWLAFVEYVWRAYPQAKMLIMYRPEEEIMESLDRELRADPAHPDFQGAPVEKAVRFQEYWPKRPPLAWALPAYRERRFNRPDKRVMYINYNTLVKDHDKTIETMGKIFKFIGAEPFDVDPENVTKEAYEIDGLYGPLGNHRVRTKVGKRETS